MLFAGTGYVQIVKWLGLHFEDLLSGILWAGPPSWQIAFMLFWHKCHRKMQIIFTNLFTLYNMTFACQSANSVCKPSNRWNALFPTLNVHCTCLARSSNNWSPCMGIGLIISFLPQFLVIVGTYLFWFEIMSRAISPETFALINSRSKEHYKTKTQERQLILISWSVNISIIPDVVQLCELIWMVGGGVKRIILQVKYIYTRFIKIKNSPIVYCNAKLSTGQMK